MYDFFKLDRLFYGHENNGKIKSMAPHGHLLAIRCRFVVNFVDCVLWTEQYFSLQEYSWSYSNNLLNVYVYLVYHMFS